MALLRRVDSGTLALVENRLGELTLGMDAVVDVAVDADCVLLARDWALASVCQTLGSTVEADVGLARACLMTDMRPGSVLTTTDAMGLVAPLGFDVNGRRLETLGLNDDEDEDGCELVLGWNALGRRLVDG